MRDIHVSKKTLDKCIKKMFEPNDIIERYCGKKFKEDINGNTNREKRRASKNSTI